ncbi:MarR family winged helix-turn-helix transcriptional regulator [Nocardia pseudobrasiliensis]|uniref:DNA-binding MarR family transcriptional regulator n=1 Tax=Nocardia pseudobrasiliensis TaxID=45979 RepID=A0A370I4L0_9NOCA|nr:MarR family winged helix-turn-helix transcriptional regulator [Nocardia pseudobrasiliensis]RDI65659.1 DNA-binding MarR family transcriptional regulator [Nocardia pseudobrasiliensis]
MSPDPESPPTGGEAMITSVTARLIMAGRLAARGLEEALAEHGLSLRLLGALGHLARNPELSYSDLARRAGITAQSMHATVRNLENMGAVARRNAGQGRRARLEVTEHGRALLTIAAEVTARLDRQLLDLLTPDHRAGLTAALAALIPGPPPRP